MQPLITMRQIIENISDTINKFAAEHRQLLHYQRCAATCPCDPLSLQNAAAKCEENMGVLAVGLGDYLAHYGLDLYVEATDPEDDALLEWEYTKSLYTAFQFRKPGPVYDLMVSDCMDLHALDLDFNFTAA